MNILFCTDGSEISFNSIKNLSAYTKHANVDIICVIDWNFLPISMNIDTSNYSQIYENIAESVLIFAEKKVQELNFTVTNKIKSLGAASDMILEQISSSDYDLVVFGSNGKKGIEKWLGSVSRQIIANSPTACFVSKKETSSKKILITTDGSHTSLHAAKIFLDHFDTTGKEIYILTVIEKNDFLPYDISLDKNWLDSIEKAQKIHAIKSLNKLKNLFDDKIKINQEVILTGNPAYEIINFCKSENIDLIVLGAQSKNNLSKLLIGSVSKRVIENVTCDVLVVNKQPL